MCTFGTETQENRGSSWLRRMSQYLKNMQETHLSFGRTVVSLRVESEELLGQLHLQVTVHGAVVIPRAAGLQDQKGSRTEGRKRGRRTGRGTKEDRKQRGKWRKSDKEAAMSDDKDAIHR